MEAPKQRELVPEAQCQEEEVSSEVWQPPSTNSAPSAEGRVRRSQLNLPVINLDRLRAVKALVDKAVKLRKVFSIHGPYPVVRAALRARGWVEHRMPRPGLLRRRRRGDEEGDRNDVDASDDDDDDDDDSPEEVEKEDDPDNMYDLMSRMVRNEMTYFYWTTRRDTIDNRTLRKEQMTNHFAKAGTFTTKVGLCVNLRSLQWYAAADPDSFFPRCYRLGAEDEKHAFIEDFRRTACTSLLQCVVERIVGEGQEFGETTGLSPQGQKRSCKRRAATLVSSTVIQRALRVCQAFMDSLDHSDIDVAMETSPTLTEQEWGEFIHNYYRVVHDGVEIEASALYADSCQAMLKRLWEVSPQLDTDGIHNIWIIKPGAKSRGRGIMCVKHLDEILRLVDSDPVLIKDSKWVVQKYLERPLLIHGTKFDIRQWFLVTDWNPLTIWFYNKCYLRFSTQPYSLETLDSSVHLCNNSIQKHFRPSPLRNPELPEDNMWSCDQFRVFLGKQGREAEWEGVVVPGMQQAVMYALQTAQDLVEWRRGSFELYGADFMLGRDLRPWLIEINASPTMSPSTVVTARLCAAVQEDTLRVVLDRRLDRNADTGGFKLIYKQAPVEVPQYVGVNLLVEGAPLRRPRPPPQRNPVPFNPAPIILPRAVKSCPQNFLPKHRPPGRENKMVAEKKGSPKSPRRWRKGMVRQFTFSNLSVPPVNVLECPTLTSESKKVQRVRLSLTTIEGVSRSQDSPWNRSFPCGHTPRPRNVRLLPLPDHSSNVHSGPVLPLEVISLQHGLLGAGQSFDPAPLVSHPGLQLHPLCHVRKQVRANQEGCAGVKQSS
ncbi:tubulin monoglycylase TTLL3-like isoform X2 [Anguilla anguilla]|uniref:tubulin monoglycylase TTLL3-like isoform X2 n=1 Tax=Anguilla anguilla TaxID=7936 RepID=UPI0015A90F8F|nr:tubulin monoglycylase TTLL3-like isoform X2 [Anguilla anguilla]